jgi:ribosomal protein S18 acetylase RimI-like enzyme
MQDVETAQTPDANVKSVFCFAIANDHRRKGIATRLLRRVCEDAKAEGYEAVEAYPKKTMKDLDAFEGPLEMYKGQGFVVAEDHGEYLVVRKNL